MGHTSCPFYSSLEDATTLKQARLERSMQGRDILKGGNISVRAGGRGVLGVYCLLENIIHCQSEVGEDSSQGGEDSPLPPH